MTRQCLYTKPCGTLAGPTWLTMTSKTTPSSRGKLTFSSGVWDQVIKRSMHKLNAPPRWQPAKAFGPTPGEFATFSSESLILAQDERWRHA